jgi:cytochrome c
LDVMDAVNLFIPSSAPGAISAIVMCVLLAALSASALFIVRGVAGDDGAPDGRGKQFFLRMALITGLLQVALAPVALLLLAPAGLAVRTYAAFYIAMAALVVGLFLIWRELSDPTRGSGVRFPLIAVLFTAAGIGLISTRLIHKDEVTYAFQKAQQEQAPVTSTAAGIATIPTPTGSGEVVATTGASVGGAATSGGQATVAVAETNPELIKGEAVFKLRCSICHLVDRRLIGPPLQEIAKIYKDNPAGIVAWAKAPTPIAKRASEGYIPMPPVIAPDEEIHASALYILKIGATP